MWEGETRYENATWREICENRRSGGKGSGVTHQRVGVTCGEEGHDKKGVWREICENCRSVGEVSGATQQRVGKAYED